MAVFSAMAALALRVPKAHELRSPSTISKVHYVLPHLF